MSGNVISMKYITMTCKSNYYAPLNYHYQPIDWQTSIGAERSNVHSFDVGHIQGRNASVMILRPYNDMTIGTCMYYLISVALTWHYHTHCQVKKGFVMFITIWYHCLGSRHFSDSLSVSLNE